MGARVRLELIQSKPWNAYLVVDGSSSSDSLALQICICWDTGLVGRDFPTVLSLLTFCSFLLDFPDCSLHSSIPSIKSDFFTVFFHCCFPAPSNLALNIGEAWSRPEWPKRDRFGICIVWEELTYKNEGWTLKNFSIDLLFPVTTSREICSLRLMDVFVIFFQTCVFY